MKRAVLLSLLVGSTLTLAAAHGAEDAGQAAAAARPAAKMIPAQLPAILAAIRAPGAKAVLVTVWASWCEPCREEMPAILRFYREHEARGLRLVLVSADDSGSQRDAEQFLASLGVDFPSYRKLGDDMAFINGLNRRWDGTIPASFGYDGAGKRIAFWSGQVDARRLARTMDPLLGVPQPRPQASPQKKSGRKP